MCNIEIGSSGELEGVNKSRNDINPRLSHYHKKRVFFFSKHGYAAPTNVELECQEQRFMSTLPHPNEFHLNHSKGHVGGGVRGKFDFN